MVKNKFKNILIQTFMDNIFNNGTTEFEYYRTIAVYHLVKEWPSKRAQNILNSNCKIAMIELSLVLQSLGKIPLELHSLMVTALIGFWPNHFQTSVSQDTLNE